MSDSQSSWLRAIIRAVKTITSLRYIDPGQSSLFRKKITSQISINLKKIK